MQPMEVTSPRIMQSEEVKLMRLEKDSLYFEARVITMVGSLHWFGDTGTTSRKRTHKIDKF